LWTKAPPNFELDSGIIAHFDIIYAEPSLLERGVPFYDAGDT
jgi:hypothetical protein